MGYLHLADNGTQSIMENYIFIPAGFQGSMEDQYVREDFFDDLPEGQYEVMMEELAPYNEQMLSGWFDKESRERRRKARAERRKARRDRRDKRRKDRRDSRADRVAKRREYRLARRKQRIDSGGSLGNIVNQVTGTARSIFGKAGS